jgi:KipI family sensor histidine kinase inhibitor
MILSPLGDSAVVLTLGDIVDEAMAARVRALAAAISHHLPRGVLDVVPAFASVAVFYDPALTGGFPRLRAGLESMAARAELAVVSMEPRRIEIPVCYGGEYGPDLATAAAHAGLTADEAIALHAAGDYLVHAIGFVPGFPYLGGLARRLATPRRATPRRLVPAGAVGIGGEQTGVYPLATPGGWNLIGRTPARLFDPARAEPALLRAGDRVRFKPVPSGDFQSLDQDGAPGTPERSGAPAATPTRLSMTEALPGIEVIRSGMFTTVQDLGRTGHRAQGVVLSGAVDAFAMRLANLVVGNAESAAGLEFTLVGPELKFLHDTVVALGGADFGVLPRWRPVRIRAGTQLKFGAAQHGYRGYLALAGGLDVAPVLGSRSTYVRAGFGGLAGRPLREGDILPVPDVPRILGDHWRIDERIVPPYSREPTVRVVRGAQADEFGAEFHSTRYTVTPQADRMGVRLRGPALVRASTRELLSSPVAPGTVQVPPDGEPIALLADAQTIGGYPQIAHVIAVDLPLVAQLRPGDALRFREVTLEEAHELTVAREHAIAILREGLAQKFA